MAQKINNVSELASDIGFNNKEITEIKNEINNKSVSRLLTVLRTKNNYTQGELAKKLKVTQSYVSKLENCTNDKIGIDDIGKYVSILGYEFSISIGKPKSLVEKIISTYKYLVHLFEQLQKTQRDDKKILLGLAKFESEAGKNMLNLALSLVSNSKEKIKHIQKSNTPKIVFEDNLIEESEDIENAILK